jgi:hypothetical protein
MSDTFTQVVGLACINGETVDKRCAEMSNEELADFIDQGAWRTCAGSDESAYQEAAKRLRRIVMEERQ